MIIEEILYTELLEQDRNTVSRLESGLQKQGIIGIVNVPHFLSKSETFIKSAREFSSLDDVTKRKYKPNRNESRVEGFEIGAEWFKNDINEWEIDYKKASYYATIPDNPNNIWPNEVNIRTSYIPLASLILDVGKLILNSLKLNDNIGLNHKLMTGCGRMLHYLGESDINNSNDHWCGSHVDHGLLTGLIPAHYFCDGKKVEEPSYAGLYVKSRQGNNFEKIQSIERSIIFFQMGEFGQLISNDRLFATPHLVKKAFYDIERYTFALFLNPDLHFSTKSTSILQNDPRYLEQQTANGSITYKQWQEASYARYRAHAMNQH